MKTGKILSIILLTAAAASALSCKHKDDKTSTTYSDYFSGTPSFSVPAFVQQGEQYTLTPGSVSRTSDDESTDSYGIIWSISPIMDKADTVRFEGEDAATLDGSFSFTVPDTLCTMTITCTAYAKGYYNTSSYAYSIIIDPSEEDGSLTGLSYPEPDTKFVDSRDGQTYRYVTVGGLDWMARNLAWNGAGESYFESEVMDVVLGRFYTWEEASASGTCPSGWRLPSNADWLSLSNAISGRSDTDALATFTGVSGDLRPIAYLNENRLWQYQPSFDINNSVYMNILPAGYATVTDGNYRFYGLQYYAAYWVSDERDADQAYYRYIYDDRADIMINATVKDSFATTVRCVR